MESTRRQLFIDTDSSSEAEKTSISAAKAWFADSYEASLSSDTESSESLSSVSNASNASLNTFTSFFKPLKVDCELENTFAELAKFTEDQLYKLGNHCPTNSPMASPTKMKQKPSLIDSNEMLIRLPIAYKEFAHKYDNKCFVKIHNDSGRNYNRLMNAAKLFSRRIHLMEPMMFEKFIDDNNIQCMERTLINLRKLPAIHFIAFLYLADKYPLVTDQTFMMLFMVFQQELDIYKKFNELDGLLKKTTLTKTAMEAHLMVKEGVEKFGIKL